MIKSRKEINTSADPLLGAKVRNALQPALTWRGKSLENLSPTVKPRDSAEQQKFSALLVYGL